MLIASMTRKGYQHDPKMLRCHKSRFIRGSVMNDLSLEQLEREVEAARAKLANDLSILRSPATAAEFTETLKKEVMDAKDAILDNAKTRVQSSIGSMVEGLKARAAANPAAALAIGAGIAWRLARHPPIATALVGTGLLSLFHTTPAQSNVPADYLSQATARLKEQATEIVGTAKERTAAVSDVIAANITNLAGQVEQKGQDLSSQAKEIAADTKEHAAAMWHDATDAIDEALGAAHSATSAVASDATATVDEWRHEAETALNDPEVRDKFLLGAAGLGVAIALGISCQRRMRETHQT